MITILIRKYIDTYAKTNLTKFLNMGPHWKGAYGYGIFGAPPPAVLGVTYFKAPKRDMRDINFLHNILLAVLTELPFFDLKPSEIQKRASLFQDRRKDDPCFPIGGTAIFR